MNCLSLVPVILALAVAPACAKPPQAETTQEAPMAASLDFKAMKLTALDGSPMAASQLDGKAVLFVNVASRCGYTKQYEGLQALFEAKKDSGLVIVGVPSNQFGGQEPGSPKEIASFCKMNFGVTFPLLEKQDVNGSKRSDLYRKLIGSAQGGGSDVSWNFEKFLVDRNGSVVGRFKSGVTPESSELDAAINEALGA